MSTPAITAPTYPVRVPLADVALNGDLCIPAEARGLVVFAHGSGSSRHSPRNRSVAEMLRHHHLGTLLLDLLTGAEERADAATAEFRFDIPLLADRLVAVLDWAALQPQTSPLAIGLFGASTGAAAALIAAAKRPDDVRAVVSRGGRPDLAEAALKTVVAPTLLIVGGRDDLVKELNRQAFELLSGPKELKIVQGATHLFEEPGTLGEVARSATKWFAQYLVSPGEARSRKR